MQLLILSHCTWITKQANTILCSIQNMPQLKALCTKWNLSVLQMYWILARFAICVENLALIKKKPWTGSQMHHAFIICTADMCYLQGHRFWKERIEPLGNTSIHIITRSWLSPKWQIRAKTELVPGLSTTSNNKSCINTRNSFWSQIHSIYWTKYGMKENSPTTA